MFKALIFATVATLSLAQSDYPMPDIPSDFVAESIHYTYQNKRLAPTGQWQSQKWSSKLNKIYETQGTFDDEGDEVVDSIEVTDATAKTAVSWKTGETTCTNAQNVPVENVASQLANFFDGFTYAGVQYAPWELTRVKYHRLDGKDVQFFYKQANLMLRFIVWPGETTTYVWDYRDGLVATDFTDADFTIEQCKAKSADSVIAQLLQQ